MIVERLMDGSVLVSDIIGGQLVSKKYYLEGSNKQNLREAYKLFLEEKGYGEINKDTSVE
jgi:hypothetical protein